MTEPKAGGEQVKTAERIASGGMLEVNSEPVKYLKSVLKAEILEALIEERRRATAKALELPEVKDFMAYSDHKPYCVLKQRGKWANPEDIECDCGLDDAGEAFDALKERGKKC